MPKKSGIKNKTKKGQEGGAIPFTGKETLAEAFARPEGEFEVKSSIRFYSYKVVLTKDWLTNFAGISRKSVQDVLANTINMLAEANKNNNSLTINQLVDMAKTQVQNMPREAFATTRMVPVVVATAAVPGEKRGRKSSTPPADKGLSPISEEMAGPSQPAPAAVAPKPKMRKLPKALAPAAPVASPPRLQSPPAMAPVASPPRAFEGQANALADLMRNIVNLERGPTTKTERTLLKDLSAAQKKYESDKAKEEAAIKKGMMKTKRAKKQQVKKEIEKSVKDITEALRTL